MRRRRFSCFFRFSGFSCRLHLSRKSNNLTLRLIDIHHQCCRHDVLTRRIDGFNFRLAGRGSVFSYGFLRCCSLFVQYALVAVAVRAVWTLAVAVTARYAILRLLLIVLNILLLLIAVLAARIAFVVTRFLTLLLARDLNNFLVHLMCSIFLRRLFARLFVLVALRLFIAVVVARRFFVFFSRFVRITAICFLRYS